MAQLPLTSEEAAELVYGADKVSREAHDFPPVLTTEVSALTRIGGGDGVEGAWTVSGLFPMIPLVLQLPCSMTVYRAGNGEVSLFNAIRVSEALEDEILALGPVKHVVKLGQFHGAADAYWTLHEKFGRPKYWTLPGGTVAKGFKADEILSPQHLPISGAVMYQLEDHPFPEAVLTVPLESIGPLLVACDCLVHMVHTVGLPILSRIVMNLFGFISAPGAPQGAPLWTRNTVKFVGKDRVKRYFDDIIDLEWRALSSSHGTPALDCDHEALRRAVYKQIGV